MQKTIKNIDVKNKKVLVRCDFNAPSDFRIERTIPGLKYLEKRGAKLILMSHLKEGKSLKPVWKKAAEHIKADFLENLRKDKREEENSAEFAKELAKTADIYVNDAFSVCHRKQTSILLPKYIKKSCAGRILEREVNALKKIKLKKTLYVLGGAKPEDNIKLIGKHRILSCGLFGQVCLINKGKKLGEQEIYLRKKKAFVRIPKNKLKKVETPIDFAVDINGRKEISLNGFPNRHEIFDIGSETQKRYVREIRNANAIYMKGPAGDCAKKGFSEGTFSILRAIANSKAFSVIGGGHLSDAIEASRINKKKFGHISLSGGALLNYIAGEKLPGLEALK